MIKCSEVPYNNISLLSCGDAYLIVSYLEKLGSGFSIHDTTGSISRLPFVHLVLQIMGNFMLIIQMFMSRFSVQVENLIYIGSNLHVYYSTKKFSKFMVQHFNLNLLLVGGRID